jgi:glycerophosphoryl diester phosphodiesterase
MDEGIPAIELDVQSSRDGELVLVHNLDLAEVSTGTGPVNETNWAELQQLYAGDPARGEDRIPRLADLLELTAGYPADNRAVLNVELKGSGTGAPSGQLIRKWIDSGRLRPEDFLISAFDWQELVALQQYCPELDIALLAGAILRKPLLERLPCGPENFHQVFAYPEEDFILPKHPRLEDNLPLIEAAYPDPIARAVIIDITRQALDGSFYTDDLINTALSMKAVAINLWFQSLSVDYMHRAQDAGLKVNLYTINDMEDIRRWAEAGADGIFTDVYREARDFLAIQQS